MKEVTVLVVLLSLAGAAGAQPSPTPLAVAAAAGQQESGFALELNLGSRLLNLSGLGTTASIGMMQGGLFAGYKTDRVIFGLGFDIARISESTSPDGGGDTSDESTAFFFVPGVRVAIVRSADQRVELFGQFDLGLGTVITDESPSPPPPQPDVTRFRLNYNLGPGVRFWAHPQFALGALVGVHGDFAYDKIETTVGGTTTSTTNTTTVTSIFAALQLMGVF
ncbi:MAG: outer membrane beta-barrel protein [Deltaproteobacteria bacterium]|nr:outer membrane beta-barrel protein [Deltaproteobacteria bacterium]